MNQITERIDRAESQGGESPFAQAMSELVGGAPLAAFRIGHSDARLIRSPRRPLDEVVR